MALKMPPLESLLSARLQCRTSKILLSSLGRRRLANVRAQVSRTGTGSVVDVKWLHSKLSKPGTKVLDASWYMPKEGRNPVAEFKEAHIPGAQFFDINSVSDTTSDLPHMLPDETGFAAAADSLGIERSDHVVVYDGMGLFSAARAWWTFKVFGHPQVSVLNGGFPAWKRENLEVESAADQTDKEILKATEACRNAKNGTTKYPATLDRAQVRNLEMMMGLLKTKSEQVIDARSSGRFLGTAPEPREGMRSGRIPGSLNIPFAAVLTPEGFLKSKEELKRIVMEAGVDMKKDAVVSCGSGVTACILALILDHIGFDQQVAVYDGSWSEWGMRNDTPVER